MPLSFSSAADFRWSLRKIAVIGPGIVGMPMAALLAHARICEGSDEPARVVVVQRDSPTSGWKVAAINAGRSVIGGIEPALDDIVRESVAAGLLSATADYGDIADADLILVSVQTDRKGLEPDYGPLFDALEHLALALLKRPPGNIPVIVFESTLAPSSMATVVRAHFARHGLLEGRDILLGNSPNRVMPGRLAERVAASDKLVAGLHPLTPVLVARVYSRIVTGGELHQTNSMTAEVVKTLENAYRDVRIAFAAEVVRHCDREDIDFYRLRDAVNVRIAQTDSASADATAVPSGAVLVPTTGVGGHCLPKDGILLWWRALQAGPVAGPEASRSLILRAREINDESPASLIALAERAFGPIDGRRVALMGTAYRFDSEDTRNSPTLALARLLIARGCAVRLHDPYVKPDDQNLRAADLTDCFTGDAARALADAQIVIFCTGHAVYRSGLAGLVAGAVQAVGVVDGANLFRAADFAASGLGYAGIGRGAGEPSAALIDAVEQGFRAMEDGVADEVAAVCDFLNAHFAHEDFNRVRFEEVRRLAATCPTGCAIAAAPQPHGSAAARALTGSAAAPMLRLARRDASGVPA
jgi:UDP-N-acetyl-D-mannosaminuronic acid dehydrogenase